MRNKIARALRKALEFKPSDERKLVKVTVEKEVELFPGMAPVKIPRITVLNEPDSPRDMYQMAKKLFYKGQVKNIDTSK